MKTLSKVILIFIFFFFCGLLTISYADIPKTLNFQGRLTDKDGNSLTGNQTITVSIYDVASGGTALWSETQNVTTLNGIYNCVLGNITALDLAFNKPYYLELSVAGQVLSPRQKLSANPYALNSERLGGVPAGSYIKVDSNGKVGIGTTTAGNAMIVDTKGNVGIGTMAPLTKFSVQQSNSGNLATLISTGLGTSTSGGAISLLMGSIPTAADQRLGGYVLGAYGTTIRNTVAIQAFSSQPWTESTALGSYLTFSTTPNNSGTRVEAMRINAAGNVGIGTTAPAQKLDVTGTTQTQSLKINSGSNQIYTLAKTGNVSVGIIGDGTAAASFNIYSNSGPNRSYNSQLTLWGAESGGTGNNYMRLTQVAGAYGTIRAAGNLVLQSTSGNVGIGTPTPVVKLHVAGKVKAQEFITGDITFTNKATGEALWNMFEDENGLYLKNIKTGKAYKFLLEEVK